MPLEGIGTTPRVGVGPAHWVTATTAAGATASAGAPDEECGRLATATDTVAAALEAAAADAAVTLGEEEAAIFEAQQLFLTDPTVTDAMDEAIADGASAEAAVTTAFDALIEQFEAMDGRMAERADDLRDVRSRLLGALGGASAPKLSVPDGGVVLAERLTPAETIGLDAEAVAGIATVTGGGTAHAAIIAQALEIPAVVGVGEELTTVIEGQTVVVDGVAGEVVVDPPRAEVDRRVGTQHPVIDAPVQTADGVAVQVAANVTGAADAQPAADAGADGVGLLRSEALFLEREQPPDAATQTASYAAVIDVFDGAEVIIRTLDVGGDKPVTSLPVEAGPNPMLGPRGIRLSRQPHRAEFTTQLEAIVTAAATADAGRVGCMFPMVSTVEELAWATEQVDAAVAAVRERGEAARRPAIGTMIETPAAVFIAEELAARCDFLSLGTNDLTQYVMAADREAGGLGGLVDARHPAVLRAIAMVAAAGEAAGTPVHICGQLAGDPEMVPVLVGLGITDLSVAPVSVPAVKAAVQAVDATAASTLAEAAVAATDREAVIDLLEAT